MSCRFGPGKEFVNNKGITGRVLGGLQIGFLMTYQTGTPFGVSENGNPLGTANGFNRPNRVASVPLSVHYTHPVGRARNTASVIPAGAFALTGPFELGNAVRNYTELRNPGNYNENFDAQKRFLITERVNFVLKMDYFNAFNRTIFNGPASTNLNSNGDYGIPGVGQNNTQRQGQIEGRINF